MITIAILAAAFIAGASTATILLLRAGITREESDKTLFAPPMTRASAVTRRIVNLKTEVTVARPAPLPARGQS